MNLYPHQQDALDQTVDRNHVAYYHDMGLGKTYTGGEKMRQLNAPVNLIICQKSKIDDWKDHIKKHIAYQPEFVYDLTNKCEFSGFFDHIHQLENDPATTENCYGVINYDLVFRRPELKYLTNFTLMLDESSLISNEKAKRTKFILSLAAANVILLSGTPTAGKYERLWSQLHLLGWDITKRTFYSQYIVTDYIENHQLGFRIPVVTGYKNVDRLKRKLREHGALFLKTEEVMNLPSKNFIDIKCRAPKFYKKFLKEEYIEIDGVEYIGDSMMSKRIYARMICSNLNPERIATFKDLVSSTEDRLVVFYNYNDEFLELRSALIDLERSVSVMNGEEKDLEAYENDESSVTLVQYQAGAMGLNLQKANKIIFFSPTDRVDLWMQAEKRIHRIGQDRACFYYKLFCPDTIEERIYDALSRGVDYTDDLFREELERYGV